MIGLVEEFLLVESTHQNLQESPAFCKCLTSDFDQSKVIISFTPEDNANDLSAAASSTASLQSFQICGDHLRKGYCDEEKTQVNFEEAYNRIGKFFDEEGLFMVSPDSFIKNKETWFILPDYSSLCQSPNVSDKEVQQGFGKDSQKMNLPSFLSRRASSFGKFGSKNSTPIHRKIGNDENF